MVIFKRSPVLFAITLLVFVRCSENNCPNDQRKPWSYHGANGPSHWSELGYSDCDGHMQSPIDLAPNVTRPSGDLLTYVGYEIPVNGDIENNGYNIEIIQSDGVTRGLKVGGLMFGLHQPYFYFGDETKKTTGSQHSIEGRGYAMEVDLVHRIGTEYVILGVFFEEVDTDNPNLEAVLAAVNSVEYLGDRRQIKEPINLDVILPKCRNTFYRYRGSLTFPPCTETVTWFILKEAIPISTNQLQVFRKQHSVKEFMPTKTICYLENNLRPLQPRHGRRVTLFEGDC